MASSRSWRRFLARRQIAGSIALSRAAIRSRSWVTNSVAFKSCISSQWCRGNCRIRRSCCRAISRGVDITHDSQKPARKVRRSWRQERQSLISLTPSRKPGDLQHSILHEASWDRCECFAAIGGKPAAGLPGSCGRLGFWKFSRDGKTQRPFPIQKRQNPGPAYEMSSISSQDARTVRGCRECYPPLGAARAWLRGGPSGYLLIRTATISEIRRQAPPPGNGMMFRALWIWMCFRLLLPLVDPELRNL